MSNLWRDPRWGFVLVGATVAYALTDPDSPLQIVDIPAAATWVIRICGWGALAVIIFGVARQRRERRRL